MFIHIYEHNVMRPVSLATEQLIGKLHKSEDVLIASTLLVVKAKDTFWNAKHILSSSI